MEDSTIDYYTQHAQSFVADTASVDMGENHRRFLVRVPAGGRILDLGCGSGRDSLAFLRSGYRVLPVDGSPAMLEATRRLTGLPGQRLRFDELNFEEEFDGIWACASLLHVPLGQLEQVLSRVWRALKAARPLYVSFKKGSGERQCGPRHFTDLELPDLEARLRNLPGVGEVELWESSDVRPGRAGERWSNGLAVRQGSGPSFPGSAIVGQ